MPYSSRVLCVVILERKEQSMRDIRNWLILILLLIVIIGALHTYNKTGKSEVYNLKEKLDSALKPHKDKLIEIDREKKRAILKIRIDSAKHYHESEASRKEISSLQRQLKAVKYTGDPSKVSDDSIKIAMQAAKEAPVKDMLLSSYEKEMDRLNAHIEGLQVDYSQLLDLSQQESNQKDKIINDWETAYVRLEKENKRLRRKGIWTAVKVGAATGVIAYIIGSLK